MKIVMDENIVEKDRFKDLGDVTSYPAKAIKHNVLTEADALIVRSTTPVTAALVQRTPLKFVGSTTSGIDHVDTTYLQDHHIKFASAPGCNATAVAEYVIAGLFNWQALKKLSLDHCTIGIVGVGNVGSLLAKKLKQLSIPVRLYDPYKAQIDPTDFEPLEHILNCDVVTLHVPLTRSGPFPTQQMFGSETLKKIKKGGLLINTSRGGVVDEVALKQCLRCGRLAGTILDVWMNEPAIDIDLLSMADIGTPHIAGYSLKGRQNGSRIIYKALRDFMDKQRPPTTIRSIEDTGLHKNLDRLAGLQLARTTVHSVAEAITFGYPIQADDQQLRRITALPTSDRPNYFRKLRKNYRMRPEFSEIPLQLSSSSDLALKNRLESLGFPTST